MLPAPLTARLVADAMLDVSQTRAARAAVPIDVVICNVTNTLRLGDVEYRLMASRRDDQWTAHAIRSDSGDQFGITCAGESADEAIGCLTRWLEWQSEHAAALEALQRAERAYHRTIAGSAFANPIESPTAIELQKESLDDVEAARVRLDEVRARKPD